jgi:hypothetical protein
LGLMLGGAMANVGNWVLTHAVVDFLVMPWATVNLADLLIMTGAAVVCAGRGAQVLRHLIRLRRPGKSENLPGYDLPTTSAPSPPLEPASKTAMRLCHHQQHCSSVRSVHPYRPPNTAQTAVRNDATSPRSNSPECLALYREAS